MARRKQTPTYYYKDPYHNQSPSSTDRHVTSLGQSALEFVTSVNQQDPATTQNYKATPAVDWRGSAGQSTDQRVTFLPQSADKPGPGRQPFQSANCKQDTDPYDNRSRSPLLLCSEKFISPTPPIDDSGWTQPNGSTVWTYSTTVGQGHADSGVAQHDRVYGIENSTHSTHIHNEPNFNPDTQSRYTNHKPIVNWNAGSAYINHEPSVNRETQNADVGVVPDTQNNSHAVILISDKSAKPKDLLLKTALLGGVVSQGDLYSVASTGVSTQAITSQCVSDIRPFVSNDVDSCRRMSGTNGYDRSRMTGSSTGGNNSSLSRLSDDHTCQGQSQPPGAGPDAMLVSHLGGAAGVIGVHDAGSRSIVSGTAGAGPQAGLGGVLHPPHSASSDPAARYGPVYTSGSSTPTVGSFTPLYASPHGQAGALSPYSPFYSQYPGYPSATVPTGHLRPLMEPSSYSEVLQSMSSQAAQSQVSRPSFGSAPASAAMAPYSLLGTTRTNTSPSSAKGFSRPSVGGVRDMRTDREEIDLKMHREQEIEMQRRFSTGFLKEEKPHHFPAPTGYPEPSRASLSSALRESPNMKRDLPAGVGDFYKVPSGRESSLKYRLLRQSDTSPGSVSIGNPQHSAFTSTEEPSPKRTKQDSVEIGSTLQSHVINRESNVAGPGMPASDLHKHLQYPQHFMKGSVIQLANGNLKHVEDLETDDFIQSAEVSNDLKIDSSTVLHIEESVAQGTAVLGFVVGEHKVQVTVEATLEHPFFVFGQGWSSCQPARTIQRYGLECHKLTVGDVCISLTHKDVTNRAAEISKQQQQQSRYSLFKPDIVSSASAGQGSYGQGHRSVSEAGELGGPIKDEHQFTVPLSQPANTEAQEQKSP